MASYKVIEADRDEYRRIATPDVLDFPGSIFYEPDFLITASEILGLNFKPVVCYQDESIVGLANYLIGGKGGVKIAAIPKLFQYFGPIALNNEPSVYKSLTDPVDSLADAAIFSLTPEGSSNFNLPGWRIKKRLTYYLKPDDIEVMRSSFSRSSRKRVNKAFKANVDFKIVREFPYDLYLSSFKRQKARPPLDSSTLISWTGRLAELGYLKNLVAFKEAREIAVLSVLIYGRYAYTWLAGSHPDYLDLGANNFLILKAGEYLYNKGIENLDLVGGDIGSIGEFKRRVGGMPINHFQVERDFTLRGKLYRTMMKLRAASNG